MTGRQRLMRFRSIALLATVVIALVVPASAVGATFDSRPTAGSPTPDDFVIQQYEDFLSRSPDRDGLDYWVSRIKAGTPPSAVAEELAQSPEFEGTLAPIVRLYYAFFRRAPDFAGLDYWSGVARSGVSIERIAEQFVKSAEFQRAYGDLSNDRYVNRVYENVLSRSADGAGAAYWRGQLAGGLSRGGLMVAFSDSAEYRGRLGSRVRATMLYVGMLRRVPEPNGLAYWTTVIDNGTPFRDVVAGFLSSTEYQRRMAEIYRETQPLTGVPARRSARRSALAVKIDNVGAAIPQTGIERADVIYEEMVEGNLTRLISVFHSDVPDAIGPVRSIRTTDIDVLAQFNRPLLSASGANSGVLDRVAGADLIDVNANRVPSAYYRSRSRSAPHNMYVNAYPLYLAANSRGGLPRPIFNYRRPGEPVVGGVSAPNGVEVAFGRTTASFAWVGGADGWARTQDGRPHTVASGDQLVVDNVVVLRVDYGASPADFGSPHAHTTGASAAHIFTAGKRISGTWSRTSPEAPIELKDSAGRPIRLTRGRTFVQLAPPGSIRLR